MIVLSLLVLTVVAVWTTVLAVRMRRHKIEQENRLNVIVEFRRRQTLRRIRKDLGK